MKLQGKSAVVTGAGQGIGAAIVHRLAEEGARVGVMDLNSETAQAVIDALPNPSDHLALPTNVGDSSEVIASVRKARETFGQLDFAVNNAGIGQAPEDGSDKFYEAMGKRNEELAAGQEPTTFVDHLIHMEDAGWQGVMNVNLNGAFYVCREAVRIMAEDGKGGAIVNISSTSAQSGEGSPHYVTSKTALIGLTRQLARELLHAASASMPWRPDRPTRRSCKGFRNSGSRIWKTPSRLGAWRNPMKSPRQSVFCCLMMRPL